MKGLIFLKTIHSLSWVCNFPDIPGPVNTHFLYKEDNVNQVKWLESVEYCRAKGDKTVYNNAGQGKCEYSRNICIWVNNNCIINPERTNDNYNECLDLLNNNSLVDGLDNGRIKYPVVELDPPIIDMPIVLSNSLMNKLSFYVFVLLVIL